jgi:four helix bundle protein
MEAASNKKYDLEDRTFQFTKNVKEYIENLPRGITHTEIGKQLMRSAGSVGANYIEANESLSKKDFLMRIKICRKEAMESRYWLELTEPTQDYKELKSQLVNESEELIKIFNSIMHKVTV